MLYFKHIVVIFLVSAFSFCSKAQTDTTHTSQQIVGKWYEFSLIGAVIKPDSVDKLLMEYSQLDPSVAAQGHQYIIFNSDSTGIDEFGNRFYYSINNDKLEMIIDHSTPTETKKEKQLPYHIERLTDKYLVFTYCAYDCLTFFYLKR